MELLRARALTRYRSKAPGAARLFDDLGLVIEEGDRVGLVGGNGSGKSTLLRLLAGSEAPVEGSVARAPGVRVALLPQATQPLEAGTVWHIASAGLADLRAVRRRLADEESRIAAGEERGEQYALLSDEHQRLGGFAAESLVREILAALGFPAASHQRDAARLSSGQRQRLALAAVLSSRADVLLLDEPTNNLDLEGRVWLEEHLANRQGASVLVSHDRALLSAATTRTAFLQDGRLSWENAGYERAATRRKSTAEARRRSARAEESRRIERLAGELERFGQLRARRPDPGGTTVAARDRAVTTGRLVSADHLSLDGVLDDVAVRVDAGERIALLGPNGSGKSALLALIAGELASGDPRSRVEYAPGLKLVLVPQESRGLAPDSPLLEQARLLLGDGRAQHVLAEAGVPHAAWGRLPSRLSGGERARAGLALAMARPFDLLLLDEPDNDLDLFALEAFEATLRQRLDETGAALLLVTHDRRLATGLAARAWSIADGRLLAHGSVRAYLRGETAVPASRFWSEAGSDRQEPVHSALDPGTPVGRDRSAAPPGGTRSSLGAATGKPADSARDLAADTEALEELEAERAGLLEELLDPLASSERERARSQERLAVVEERLMELYDQRLEPAGPSRRLVERGLTIFADPARPRRREDGLEWHADMNAPVNPVGAEDGAAGRAASTAAPTERWLALPAPDAAAAAAALKRPEESGAPWLELTRVGDGAHLRLHEPEDSCLLPWAKGAILDAGTRLAFTVLGVRFTQHFSREALGGRASAGHSAGVLLKPSGDGWWRLTLDEFLALEGWQVSAHRRRRGRRKGA